MDLGAAIKRARGPETQTALGKAIGEPQSTISRWENGGRGQQPTVDQLLAIERHCDLPAGQILRWAGYIAGVDEVTVEQAVQADPDIADSFKPALRAYVKTLRDQSAVPPRSSRRR